MEEVFPWSLEFILDINKLTLNNMFSIKGSPFKVPVDHTVDVKSVRAYGPGLDQNNVREGITQTFKVDGSKAGRAPLAVDIIGAKEKPDVKDNGDGTYDVSYKPPKEGTPIVASVKWNGKDVPNT